MATMMLRDGTAVHYELHGRGPLVALTPGGRNGLDSLRPLAEQMARGGYRAFIWDRRNCGASDVVIERRYDQNGRSLSEQELFAEDLHEVLTRLGVTPCWVGGVSAGCRVSLLLAMRHPEVVKGLVVWMVTGGEAAAKQLGYNYYEQFIDAAERGGMEGVVATEFFAERVRMNPSNRARLLGMRVADFVSVMREWRAFFTADKPVVGATEEELRRIKVPTTIIAGGDDIHPRHVAEKLHALLPQSEFHPPFWMPEERERLAPGTPEYREAMAERVGPILLEFLDRHHARAGA